MLPQVAAPRTARALPPHEAGLWLWSVAKLASAGDLLEARGFCVQDTYPTIDSRSEVYQFNKDGQVKLHFESAIHALHLVPSQPAIEHLYSRRLHGRRASRSQRPCSARSRQQCGGRSRRRSRLRLQVRRYSYSRFSILAAPFWLFHFGCTIVSESVFALVALSESHSPCVCRWQCSRSKGWRTP